MRLTAFLANWTKRCALLFLIASGAMSMASHSTSASALQAVAIVNAASFASDSVVTPNTIVAAFGQFKTLNNQTYPAQTVPLPTVLGQVSVKVNGIPAGLLIVTPGQINMVIPGTVALGVATVIVTNSDGSTLSGTCTIVASRPGVFTATSTGLGAAAAQTTFDGVVYEFTANPDGSAKPINPGTKARPNFLILYVTGLGNIQASQVKVTFLGVPGLVTYAGPQNAFAGLDQINVRVPWELAGLGILTVHVETTVGTTVAAGNDVTLNLGGTVPPILATPIAPGVINGSLTYDDQIQTSGDNVYFFDAFVFDIGAPDVGLNIDLRSPSVGVVPNATNSTAEDPSFDALLLLYRLENDQLTLVAQDDQTGGIGDGDTNVNNNALLLTVLKQPGRYVLLATTFDGNALGTGTYTLSFKTNLIPKITYGQTINGNITANSIKTSAGVYLDAYYFDATQSDRARIIMRSTAFDPFLFLYRNFTDPEIAFDDNTGGGFDAQITHTIPNTDRYIIIGTPFALNDTGAYTLQLTKLTAFEAEAAAATQQAPALPGRLSRGSQDLRPGARTDNPGETRFDRAAKRRFVIK